MGGLPFASNCPFCGHAEADICIKETDTYRNGKRVNIMFMKCYVCDASTKAFAFDEYDDDVEEGKYWTAWDNALNAWERREKTQEGHTLEIYFDKESDKSKFQEDLRIGNLVSVIRCKDCHYADDQQCGSSEVMCRLLNRNMPPNGWCVFRKEKNL